MFTRIAALTALVIAAGTNPLSAGEFAVINQSPKDVYVIVRYYVPGHTNSLLAETVSDKWVTEGHYRVPAGQRVVVHGSKNEKILVRMNYDGNFDNVVVPQHHDGEEKHLVHPVKRFETSKNIGSDTMYFRIDGKFVDSTKDVGFRAVRGFYLLPTNLNFTVR